MNDENSSLSLATCLFFSRVTKGGKSFLFGAREKCSKKGNFIIKRKKSSKSSL